MFGSNILLSLLDPYFRINGWIYRGILRVLVKNSLNLILFLPIYILYISKSWIVAFNATAPLLSHISATSSTYFQYFLSPFKLFLSLLISYFTITLSLTFTYFYLFISPLFYTLTLQFLHPFIFFLFWLFISPFYLL